MCIIITHPTTKPTHPHQRANPPPAAVLLHASKADTLDVVSGAGIVRLMTLDFPAASQVCRGADLETVIGTREVAEAATAKMDSDGATKPAPRAIAIQSLQCSNSMVTITATAAHAMLQQVECAMGTSC